MIMTVLAAALMMGPATSDTGPRPSIQQIQYGIPRHPPPCGHGWDLSSRDGLCYPNGALPPEEQAGRRPYYYRGDGGYGYPRYGSGRYPVPCGGDGVDLDVRDGQCYPTGTVPRRFQNRPHYYYRY
ncbi:hypothetical protein ABIC03_003435 [Bradyrhizobium sp. RT6a]|jgi:hypothetical protein